MQGRVTISHAFALAAAPPSRTDPLVDELAELDISLTTIAPSGQRVLPTDRLAIAGMRLGLGQDGIRDYWSPFGDGDMLGRTWQLAFVEQRRRDELRRPVAGPAAGRTSLRVEVCDGMSMCSSRIGRRSRLLGRRVVGVSSCVVLMVVTRSGRRAQ